MHRLALLPLAITLLFTATLALAGPKQHTVEAMPPVVVKTVPQSGDMAVDPALDKIEVTFSKTMVTDRMWSFVQVSDDTFPETAGDPAYKADSRTIVLPVKLDPGKPYIVWINSDKYDAFRDVGGNPAVPYLLVFETRPK
jgi:hypothetical protein